jgi:hypothetical protein
MIYAAQLDESNVVLRVIAASSIEWCVETLGGTWLECRRDGSIRGSFPGPGWTYDETNDVFVAPITNDDNEP